MPDPVATTTPDPASNPPATQTPPKEEKGADAKDGQVDPVKMAQELGELRKVKEEYETYKSRTEPVIETIWAEDETRNFVLNKHKKRLGIKDSETPPADDKDDKGDKKGEVPPLSPIEKDNRGALITQTVNSFEKTVGMDKLEPERRKELNIKVGAYLSRILDTHNTGKPVTQLIEELPLAKLPQVLEDAWYLATKEDREAEMKLRIQEQEQSETGVIGSMSSSSIKEDDVVLTSKEKEAARKMGVTEDVYLTNKKQILKNRGEIY